MYSISPNLSKIHEYFGLFLVVKEGGGKLNKAFTKKMLRLMFQRNNCEIWLLELRNMSNTRKIFAFASLGLYTFDFLKEISENSLLSPVAPPLQKSTAVTLLLQIDIGLNNRPSPLHGTSTNLTKLWYDQKWVY